jgi:MFS family permease
MMGLRMDQGSITASEDSDPANRRWWVVFASCVGMIVGQGPICIFTLSVFIKPVTADLGISRGTFASTAILLNVAAAIFTPFVGRLVDRLGVRKAVLPLILLFALATAALSLLQSSWIALYGLFALQGIFSASQTPTGYVKVISAWFDRQRGLALGIAMTGVGLGVVIIPQLAGFLIRTEGWRIAYIGVGVAVFILAFIPMAIWIREPKRTATEQGSLPVAIDPRSGIAARDAIGRSGEFWAMTIAFLLSVTAVNGTLAHVVPLLTDHGMSVAFATSALSVSGLGLIAGRLLAGYCLDRFPGTWVAWFFFVCPMVGIGIFASPLVVTFPLLGAVFCGLGIGGEIDIIAYFVGRYFGLRAYATIYSLSFAIINIGSGFGPYFMGLSFDTAKSYLPTFIGFECALAAAGILVARLGPYRYAAARRGESVLS